MKNLSFVFFGIIALGLVSCGLSESDLEGKTYYLGNYHYVEIEPNNKYEIYQKTSKSSFAKSCYGEGKYTIEDGYVVLGPNDSNCGSTQNMSGKYKKAFQKSAYE